MFAQNPPEPSQVDEEAEDMVEYAQKGSADKTYTTRDRLKEYYELNDEISQRNFEPDFQENYTSQEFDYKRTKPRISLWQKIKDKINKILSYLFKNQDASAINDFTFWVMRIAAIGIVGLVLYWLLNFILKKDGNWFFGKKNKELNPEARTIVENIHEIDLNALITKYESENNYRYSIRYRFLKLLKVFNDKGLIAWDPDKTNLDYITELETSPQQREFARLAYIFDYVWYGDFPIEAGSYAKYQEEFNRLIQPHE